MTTEQAAKKYLEAYDHYQTLYASYRLQGWNGDASKPPPNLYKSFEVMVSSLDALRITLGMGARPDYMQIAKNRFPTPTGGRQ